MTDPAAPNPELETLARAALQRAAATVTPSPSLAGRCLPRPTATDAAERTRAARVRRRTSVGVAAAAAVLAVIMVASRRDDPTGVSTAEVATTTPAVSWRDRIGSEWEELPAPPGDWADVAASEDGLVAWARDSTGGGHAAESSGSALGSTGTAWAPLRSDPVGWDSGVTATTSDGTVLVSVGAERSGPETIDHYALSLTSFTADGAGTSVPLGRVGDLDSYLTRTPAVLPSPPGSDDIAWVFAHDDVGGALTITAVSSSGRHDMPSIDRPGLRPLAIGQTPAGHPIVLAQELDPARGPSAVMAFELTTSGWHERVNERFPEADATWTGDRFVLVSASGPVGAAAAVTLDDDGQVTWSAIGEPGLRSCESPVDVIGDGAGAAVASTACGEPVFLPAGRSSWIRLPAFGPAQVTPSAASDGVVVGFSDATAGRTLVAVRPAPSR